MVIYHFKQNLIRLIYNKGGVSIDNIYVFDNNDNLLEILDDNLIINYKHRLKGNGASEFTLTINGKNNNLKKYNKVGFFSYDKGFQLFCIDTHNEYNSIDENTLTINCIDDIVVLGNNIIEDKRIVGGTALSALEKVVEGTPYSMGTVESFEKNNINFYYVSSLTGLNDIINTYGCEFRTRIIIDDFGNISKKYIDLVHRLGQDTGLRFTYDTNVNSIEKTTSDDAHFNVLYGRGASLQTDDDGYSRKISFEEVAWSTPSNPISKPVGQKFIEDSSSISKYGRLEGIYENDKIDDPELLLKKTYEKLQNVKDLNYSYSIDVEDLRHFEGFEHYKYTFGDSIVVLDEEAGITVESRILEINTEVDFIEKTKNISITLGNFRNGLVESEDNIKDVIDSIKDQLGNIEDNEIDDSEFPDTLPDAPNITGKGLFATIMLEWTYENKMYYTYELFASKVKDFAPGPSNRIFEGKASAFLHEVNPEETWYYRARAKNTHGHYTDYSTQLTISTYKISNSENYFEEAAIKDATIGELKLDRGWVGKLIGTYIDAKNLSVTDGNGNQTLLVDSFGRLYGDFTTFKINSKDVATQEWAKQEISPGYILHSINTSIQDEGTSLSTISTLLNKNGFSVYNGAINVFNKNNEKVFWVDPTGRASVSNLNIYGEERLGNIDIKGTGNKGIVIRSLDGGDRYIDFSTYNDDGSNWAQEIKQGNFTRLWAMNGDFYQKEQEHS